MSKLSEVAGYLFEIKVSRLPSFAAISHRVRFHERNLLQHTVEFFTFNNLLSSWSEKK